MKPARRQFVRGAAAGATLGALGACAAPSVVSGGAGAARVVVVGGGYAGATAAKYLRLWSEHRIDVSLVEPNPSFVSCPMSNLVIGGTRSMADITIGYEGLEKAHGVRLVRDSVSEIEPAARRLRLAGGASLAYDRLIVAPGIGMIYDQLPGLRSEQAQAQVLHAWKAGPQTLALRRQIEAMPDGGVLAIAIPLAPYRCPPGPYERACQVAAYFKREKPRSKVLIIDANEDITSKGKLFRAAWAEHFAGIIEYRTRHTLLDVDLAGRRLLFEFEDPVRADVLNVLPPMRAGEIAVRSGLATANGRWCEVDFLNFGSIAVPNVHVLGDAIQPAPTMPKSGHMANQQAKICAAAVIAELAGAPINDSPLVMNTCYSFVNEHEAVHVASVHAYDAHRKTFLPIEGAGGLSPRASRAEAPMAERWARNIWADSFS